MEQLNLSQSTVSHHVKILKRAGMLDERRSGTWNYYSLNKSGFAQVQSLFEDRLFMPVSKAVFRECPSFKKNC
jgi:ArsR family transcriptional regulator